MTLNTSRQTFHVYDPLSLKLIGEKLRVDVHSSGDWHLAVTAFIFRRDKSGNMQVLVQKRSQFVDIAQNTYDQSLATQLIVEDKNSIEDAFYRGLREELGISKTEIVSLFKWNEIGDIYISKHYNDNPELWNREIVTTYFAQVKDSVKIVGNYKVAGYEWLTWSEFCDLVRMQPNNFTKTTRIYTVVDKIAEEIDQVVVDMFDKKIPQKLSKKVYYASYDNSDFVGFESTDGNYSEAYSTDYIMKQLKLKSIPTIDQIKRYIFSRDDTGYKMMI